MTWYIFTAQDSLGNEVRGQHRADSELALMSRLRAVGMTQVVLQPMSIFRVGWHIFKTGISRFVPIRKLDLAIFYYQLADMLEIGIPLKQALLVIASHLNHPRLIGVIHHVVGGLSRGLSFSEALAPYKSIFSLTTLQLIALAHTKEELTAILRYCDQSMRRMTFFNKLLFVILPQLSIMIALFLILLFLRFHYLPSFYYAISIFRNPLPPIIHFFDIATGMLTVHLLRTVVIVIAAIFICRVIVALVIWVRFVCDFFWYYVPVVGGVILALERERLSLLYHVLLKDGSSVQQCVKYSIAVARNLLFKRHVQKMCSLIQCGEDFSRALKLFSIFSIAEIQMIALGAASNSLVKTFSRLYSISQMILERRLFVCLEVIRFISYVLNVGLFFFAILVAETLFFYPGAH